MSSKDALAFLDRILKNFPPYQWTEDRQAEWVNSVVREVGGMPKEALERAAGEMVRNRKVSRTPLVAEIVEACKEARYWVDREKQATELPVDRAADLKFAIWSEERKRLADDICMAPLGKTAVKEDWIRGFHDFVRENGRAPNEHEIKRLKTQQKEFIAAYEKCLRGGWPQAQQLADLGGKMIRRGKELEDMVLHGVVK